VLQETKHGLERLHQVPPLSGPIKGGEAEFQVGGELVVQRRDKGRIHCDGLSITAATSERTKPKKKKEKEKLKLRERML